MTRTTFAILAMFVKHTTLNSLPLALILCNPPNFAYCRCTAALRSLRIESELQPICNSSPPSPSRWTLAQSALPTIHRGEQSNSTQVNFYYYYYFYYSPVTKTTVVQKYSGAMEIQKYDQRTEQQTDQQTEQRTDQRKDGLTWVG